MYIYVDGPFKGQIVPESQGVWSGGSNPQGDHYGCYVYANFAFGPNGESWDDGTEGRYNSGAAGWEVEEIFPDNPEVGEVYTMSVFGVSGTYQAWYEFNGTDWILQGDTIPWQMKV